MRRSHLFLAAVGVPFALATFTHGCSCSPESSFESICDWVADPDNCFREFRAGMLDNGADAGTSNTGVRGDCSFISSPSPTQVNPATENDGVANGAFQTTGMLATCIINSGGTVTFAPAINTAQIPPALNSTPITYQMTITDAAGNTCGVFSYTSPHGFSIQIAAPPGAGGAGGSSSTSGNGGGFGVGVGGFSDGGFQATPDFGTYTQTIAPGVDEFTVSCPSGESHFFNLDESGDAVNPPEAATTHCPGYAPLVPSASLQIDPGGVNRAGAVSFAIVYPNTTATYPPFESIGDQDGFNPDAPECKGSASGGSCVPAPQTVVYFNCSVPGAPPQCMDGVKDGSETDVDCGGPAVNGCPARCAGGQMCLCDGDCQSGICFVDPSSGSRVCYDPTNPPMNSDGGVLSPGDGGLGDGVGPCHYTNVCDAPNVQCSTGCTNLQTDGNNCGKCGNACPGTACCSGKCIDTTMDNKNCGACGNVCCTEAPTCSDSVCTNNNNPNACCGCPTGTGGADGG